MSCPECSHGNHVTGRCWYCWDQRKSRPRHVCFVGIQAELDREVA